MLVVIEHELSSPAGFLDIYLSHLCRLNQIDYIKLTPDQLSALNIVVKFRPDFLAAVVVLGGSMNVDELEHYPFLGLEKEILARLLDLKVPILGICLGAQLVAEQLGAWVSQLPYYELGWIPIWSDAGFEGYFMSWHGYGFEWPANCQQKFYGKYHKPQGFKLEGVWCYQFHPEALKPFICETQQDLQKLDRPNIVPVDGHLWHPQRMIKAHLWLESELNFWMNLWVLPRWRELHRGNVECFD